MKIALYGMLADAARTNSMELDAQDTEHLRGAVLERFPEFSKFTFVISVNRKVVHENRALQAEDEIALLPPFAGG